MTVERLRFLLEQFDRQHVLVVGDFFLDKYLVLESSLTEKSLETNLDAYQVVEKRLFPGAAGTVTSNLRALGARTVAALGLVGHDGEGYELRAKLEATGVDTTLLVPSDLCFTPTYIKPMLQEGNGERELNRLDIKNRRPCPADVEAQILSRLRASATAFDAIVVADQVEERNCGVVTDSVRRELSLLATRHPEKVFIADSRARIGEYAALSVKPNRNEALRATGGPGANATSLSSVLAAARALQGNRQRPLFVTLAEDGLLALHGKAAFHVTTLRQTGPIDVCGAGDSVMAGITLALCAGASAAEAALVGNVVASITVQQIGVTGTASRKEVLERFSTAAGAFTVRPLDG